MIKQYTVFNEKSIMDYGMMEDETDAVMFLKNPENFRPFGQGLTELLEKNHFQGNAESCTEKADYLLSKLREIHSTIEKETVYAWFQGKRRPKIEPGSRRRMYEICFALELSYEETVWFFHHVYYDRCFNCHTIEEAVFCFCFLHGISYQKALRMIENIYAADSTVSAPKNSGSDYTHFVQNRILSMQTIDELQAFLMNHRQAFGQSNRSALTAIQNLLSRITGAERSKPIIDRLKRTLMRAVRSNSSQRVLQNFTEDIDKCGLLMQEICYDAQNQSDRSASEYILETIIQRNIFKNTVVLDWLLSTNTGMSKNPDIPYIVRNNFPSKKVLSDVLDETKSSSSRSYDAIRKTLVLLDFYVFWVRIKLGITDIGTYRVEELAQIYRDETDACLYHCGYEPLFAGNPYDWIFLCSAQNEEPLAFFRGMVSELLADRSTPCLGR